MKMKLLTVVSALILTANLTGTSRAALIENVAIEAVSTEIAGREGINVVNGSGLATDGGGTYHTSTNDSNYWMTNSEGAPWSITFDLVENNVNNYDLDSFHVWNFNRTSGLPLDRSANEVQISVTDTVGGSWSILDSDPVTVGTQNFFFTQTGAVKTYGQTFDLSSAGANNVRLVKFDILSNHSNNIDTHTGLSEVQFYGVVVPEPSSFVLILLAGVSALFFRRSNGHNSAARS